MTDQDRIQREYSGKGRILTVDEFYKRELSLNEFINQTWNECNSIDESPYINTIIDFREVTAQYIIDCMTGKCSVTEMLNSPDKYIAMVCSIQCML